MKRTISIILIILLTLSITSCKSKQGEKNANGDNGALLQTEKAPFTYEGLIFPDEVIPYKINTIDDLAKQYPSCDYFVGKVVSTEVITPKAPIYTIHKLEGECNCDGAFRLDEKYMYLYPIHSEIYLYTIEIEQTINAVFTTEKTTIRMISEVSKQDVPLKKGTRYLLGGYLNQHEENTVLQLWQRGSAEVDSEGNLNAIGADAEIINSFGTVQNFANNEKIQQMFKREIAFSSGYYKDYELNQRPFDITSKDEKTVKFLADAKKALIVDNKFKMNVQTQVIDWPAGYSAEQYIKENAK